MEEIKGYVEHIVYRNEDNGYTVFHLNNSDGEVTCVGSFHYIEEGELLRLKGGYTTHKMYGLQFAVEESEICEPEDLVSIERYLGSGAIKGVGASLAGKIVKKFKEDTFRIIEEEPEPALLLSEPVWLLGRLTELYQADETQWAALADVLEAAKTLNADAQLEGLETVQFQGREYIPLAEAAQRLGLEWGEAPDGLRYLARRQTVGQIPEGWNVPVLMYHAVGDEIWGYSDLFVSEAGMEEQLQYLQENGYEPIWFSDLAHIEDYEKPVILTFDDGYDDNYTVLYPLLEKYQTKATIFVIGNAMGSQHKMTQEQVYELAASGLVSIQSHTYTHGNLSAMDEPALRQEMELSNAALAAATGQIPYVLCYPEGKYSHLTMDVAKDYYTFALRMDGWTYQTGMDPYQVPRSFVSRRITLPDYLWFLAPSGKAS